MGAVFAPLLLFSTTVAASMAVDLVVDRVWRDFAPTYAGQLFYSWWHDYFGASNAINAAVVAGGLVLEGIGAFAASIILTRRHPGLAARGVRAFAMAAAATVVVTLLDMSRDGRLLEWLEAFPRFPTEARFSYVFSDLNAAGSYHLLSAFVAGGLAFATRRWARLAWLLVVVLSLAGLWLSGSRAAFLAAPAALLILGACVAVRSRSRVVLLSTALIGLAVLVSAAYAVSSETMRPDAKQAVEYRVKMGGAALRMVRAYPVFGVGIGRFHHLSYDYLDPEWRKQATRENAHNNFLQVFAELGAVGFGAFLWLVVLVIGRPLRALGNGETRRLLAGVATGLLAFVLTWLAGHPLLVREIAPVFWLLSGICVGMTPDRPTTTLRVDRSAALGWAAWIAAALIVASVPVRASIDMRQTDLSNAGMAFSNWHRDTDGTRFRWMANRAQLFVPGSARLVSFRFRSPNGAAAIKIIVEGHLVARLVAEGSEWREATVVMPPADGAGFRPVELRANVTGPPANAPASTVPGDRRVVVGEPRVVR